MDGEASRGNKKDKEKREKGKKRGGAEEVVVVVVGRAMAHVSSMYPEDRRLISRRGNAGVGALKP